MYEVWEEHLEHLPHRFTLSHDPLLSLIPGAVICHSRPLFLKFTRSVLLGMWEFATCNLMSLLNSDFTIKESIKLKKEI